MTPPGRRQHDARGRPTDLTHEIITGDVDDHGHDVTRPVGDVVIAAIRRGATVEVAANLAGVDRPTLSRWLKAGAVVARKLAAGEKRLSRLSINDRLYLDFRIRTEQAMAQAEVGLLSAVHRMAVGGHERQSEILETRLMPDPNNPQVRTSQVYRRSVKTERAEPSTAAATWLLERRWPQRYGPRQRVELTGADGGPIETTSPVDRLSAVLLGMAERSAAARTALESIEDAVATTATEVSGNGERAT